mmetsp:Transcript_114835/g.198455  ORF Transcript_114835/g.198455 Transcript_114835/m.198455 type:complete len:102 (+) Transcript_114835:3-308(+)
MAERANAHVRWALSDETVLCYMWTLLKKYRKVLKYDPAKISALALLAKGKRGEDISVELRSETPLQRHHYQVSGALPSQKKHLKFVQTCKNLKYPREAEPE